MVAQVYDFLAEKKGRFLLYTEVTLPEWPDSQDRVRLEIFLQFLKAGNLNPSVKKVGFDQLPVVARESGCGVKFKAHGITRFTAVEARK